MPETPIAPGLEGVTFRPERTPCAVCGVRPTPYALRVQAKGDAWETVRLCSSSCQARVKHDCKVMGWRWHFPW